MCWTKNIRLPKPYRKRASISRGTAAAPATPASGIIIMPAPARSAASTAAQSVPRFVAIRPDSSATSTDPTLLPTNTRPINAGVRFRLRLRYSTRTASSSPCAALRVAAQSIRGWITGRDHTKASPSRICPSMGSGLPTSAERPLRGSLPISSAEIRNVPALIHRAAALPTRPMTLPASPGPSTSAPARKVSSLLLASFRAAGGTRSGSTDW